MNSHIPVLMEPSDGEDFGNIYHQQNKTGRGHNRSKRATSGPIYPEILAIVDYESYIMHSRDNREIKKYMISFWNGVSAF